jgi:hypothetical protein
LRSAQRYPEALALSRRAGRAHLALCLPMLGRLRRVKVGIALPVDIALQYAYVEVERSLGEPRRISRGISGSL